MSKDKKNVTTFRYPSNVTPNRVSFEKRADGKTTVYYTNKGDKATGDKKAHGHSVRRADGSVEYARTRGGKKLS
jgi:hypothetical protein